MFACHPATFLHATAGYKISFYFALFISSVKQKSSFFYLLVETKTPRFVAHFRVFTL
jgi:hypothetical protein